MRIYTFANQKGGVGKTTTVINIAASMADWGRRVLVVDMDPQSNATTSLGLNPREVSASTYDVLVERATAAQAIQPTRWDGLDLLPATPALAGATVELNALGDAQARVNRLRQVLAGLESRGYDYLLIDSPPSLGVLTVNALVAAQGVIIPVQCEYLALEGLSQLLRTIQLVQRGANPRLTLRGLVLTMYDGRTLLARQVVDDVQKHFGERVFRAVVPRSVRLSEAPSFGVPGVFHAPRSSGAIAYRGVTWELLLQDGYPVSWTPPAGEDG